MHLVDNVNLFNNFKKNVIIYCNLFMNALTILTDEQINENEQLNANIIRL